MSTLTKRPDFAFYGIGPDTREADLVRYSGKTAYARSPAASRSTGAACSRPLPGIAAPPSGTATTTARTEASQGTKRRSTTR